MGFGRRLPPPRQLQPRRQPRRQHCCCGRAVAPPGRQPQPGAPVFTPPPAQPCCLAGASSYAAPTPGLPKHALVHCRPVAELLQPATAHSRLSLLVPPPAACACYSRARHGGVVILQIDLSPQVRLVLAQLGGDGLALCAAMDIPAAQARESKHVAVGGRSQGLGRDHLNSPRPPSAFLRPQTLPSVELTQRRALAAKHHRTPLVGKGSTSALSRCIFHSFSHQSA